MKKLLFSFMLLCVTAGSVMYAQDGEKGDSEKKGFKKENLFTGGSISFGLSNSSFSVGANPVFGYSIAKWLDAGVVINYNYQSYRDIDYYGYGTNDKIKQSQYGGGAFVKIYPVDFLFAQAQVERNFNTQTLIPGNGSSSSKQNLQTNSFLIGGGYASRNPASGQPFFYLSLLFDVSGNKYTPYTDGYGRALPILRGGIQVPLFQGKKRKNYEEEDDRGGGGTKKPRNYNRY